MGPLAGIKIIEIKGIGPGPYAGMLLADMGADVIVVERASKPNSIALPSEKDCNSRGKRSIALNLKTPEGLEALLTLVEQSEVLFEGFRPGVAERLGFGPEVCLKRNPELIYGRLTGWGQTGPLAHAAGHDINYISLTGPLAAIGPSQQASIPLNLIGDYAGGSHFLVMGILAALIDVQKTGQGQVIDAAITDGTANLMSMFHSMHALGQWSPERENNFLDGAAHFYNTYETADHKHISIGSIEPQFYSLLLEALQLDPEDYKYQHDQSHWQIYQAQFSAIFKSKTRDEWSELMSGTDICFAPVLDFTEAPQHPHNKARQTYLSLDGAVQPAPAPRFSQYSDRQPASPHKEGADTLEVLREIDMSETEIDALRHAKALS